jgi:hypothetical protein
MIPEELRLLPSSSGLPAPLAALWHDAHGDWDRAHAVCQEANSADGDAVHAYLHRKEGDTDNARYWYRRARRPEPAAGVTLEAEWTALAAEFLRGQEELRDGNPTQGRRAGR